MRVMEELSAEELVDRSGVTLTNRKGYFAPSDLPAGRGAAHR